jgi:carboxyl-terminal processing protease
MLNKIKLFIICCILVATTAACAAENNKAENSKNHIEQFKSIFDKINKEHVQEPEQQKMIDAALSGMLSSLDPHSYYFTDEELQDFINQTEGQFGGIGIEIIYEEGAIKIISPIDDLPAYKADIKAGDYIISVGGQLIKTLGFNKAVKSMRGEPGTKVKIEIFREGWQAAKEFELTREIVKIKAVKFKIDDNIAYVRISTFNENTISELKKTFNQIKQTNPYLDGIVLDLRNNPGGLLDQAIKVSEYFIESGVIVETKGRRPANNLSFSANVFVQKAPKVNMVALINSGSASASEIVAGALQDYSRAIILGTKSFGKGSVQIFFKLNERSGMKLTTSKYYTPKGRCIQAEGILPDIIVEAAKVEYSDVKNESSKFFEKSYLNHLKGNNEKDDESNQKKIKAKEKDQQNATKEASEIYKNDYQYARAFDLLKALKIFSQQKNL